MNIEIDSTEMKRLLVEPCSISDLSVSSGVTDSENTIDNAVHCSSYIQAGNTASESLLAVSVESVIPTGASLACPDILDSLFIQLDEHCIDASNVCENQNANEIMPLSNNL